MAAVEVLEIFHVHGQAWLGVTRRGKFGCGSLQDSTVIDWGYGARRHRRICLTFVALA